MPYYKFALAAVLIAVAGCSSPSDDNGKNVVVGDQDMSSNNAANNMSMLNSDSGLTPDMNTATGCQATGCPETQVCNMQSGVCVDCLTNAECGANGSCDTVSNKCRCDDGFHPCSGVCSANDSVATCGNGCMPCPTIANGNATCDGIQCGLSCDAPLVLNDTDDACVGCLNNAMCSDVTASVCANEACEPCADAAGCRHLAATPMCDNGTCVECSAADDSVCGGNSCDPATGTCTATPKESVGICEPCAADTECRSGHGCAGMQFEGNARTERFCLPLNTSGCTGEYGTAVSRPNAAGQMSDYCTINESVATCEAHRDFNVPCADAADCGAPGLDDGICESVNFELGAVCTHACIDHSECPADALAINGCQMGASWCGAF